MSECPGLFPVYDYTDDKHTGYGEESGREDHGEVDQEEAEGDGGRADGGVFGQRAAKRELRAQCVPVLGRGFSRVSHSVDALECTRE